MSTKNNLISRKGFKFQQKTEKDTILLVNIILDSQVPRTKEKWREKNVSQTQKMNPEIFNEEGLDRIGITE